MVWSNVTFIQTGEMLSYTVEGYGSLEITEI